MNRARGPSRRDVLRASLALPCLPLIGACGSSSPSWHAELAEHAAFPAGTTAGPIEGGLAIVALVEGIVGPRRIGLEIAEDAGFGRVLHRVIVDVPQAPDVPLQIRVPIAHTGRQVFYRLVTRDGAAPAGGMRLLPAPGSDAPVRIGFFSCQGWQPGYFAAHAGLAAEPLDLVVSLGDYIYERTDDTGPRMDTIGAAANGFAESLEEYRAKYRLYRSDAQLQAMHAAHGFVAVWDNHELAAEYADARLPLAERAANGRAAFWEWMPMDSGPPERPLYRSLQLGTQAEIFLLDLHSYAAPIGSGGSYLGTAQRDWLLDGLSRSPARWKLIASSTVMMGLDLARNTPVNRNQWDGYPEERRQIVEHVIDGSIPGVVVLTGDLHTFLAGPVTTTGRSDGRPGFPELSGGAISSLGLLDLDPHDASLAHGLEEAARELNPHLQHIDALAKGYAVVETGPELTVTFRAVADVLDPASSVSDLARFRITPGATGVERIA